MLGERFGDADRPLPHRTPELRPQGQFANKEGSGLVNIACSKTHDEVTFFNQRRHGNSRRQDGCRLENIGMACLSCGEDDRAGINARNRSLSSGIDRRDVNDVGIPECSGEFGDKCCGAGIPVWLEKHHKAPRALHGTSRRGNRRRNLGGMMSVIIKDPHLAVLILELESSLRSPECLQSLRDDGEWNPKIHGQGDDEQCVVSIVCSRNP